MRKPRAGRLYPHHTVTLEGGVSSGALRFQEGSLYPALRRMENEGWVTAEWKITEHNRRARYYKLTRAGRKHLEQERDQWNRVTQAVALVLDHA